MNALGPTHRSRPLSYARPSTVEAISGNSLAAAASPKELDVKKADISWRARTARMVFNSSSERLMPNRP